LGKTELFGLVVEKAPVPRWSSHTLVVKMKSGYHDNGVATIEGLEETLLKTRVVGGNRIILRGTEKGLLFDHVFQHVVCPFEDLGADVDQKGVRRPAAEDHNLGHRVIHQEECHSRSGADGFMVLPGVAVRQYSQDRIAKKKAPQMMSAAWACVLDW
jgi:hypothetical protein